MTDVLLIGLDGGATEAKAHAVACDDLKQPTAFSLRPEAAARVYPRVPEFESVPVAEQLRQRDAGDVSRSDDEIEQGRLCVQAAAEAIVDVARQCGAKRILVGAGMPGLKTPDGRGIDAINNGPRIPDYLAQLERRLAQAGLQLASPIARLGSDADYCGLGEEYAADGLFRDVQNAYYVGCGTGIADAMKLRGELVPFDAARSWIHKSWQIPSAVGPTFEKLVSAKSLNEIYANLKAGAGARRHGGGSEPRGVSPRSPAYPEVAAGTGDSIAAGWLGTAALVLAELIFERLWTIRNGRADAPHRGAAYAGLDPNHPYRGTLLDRVIVGQRLGQIYADPAYHSVFSDKLNAYLAALIESSGDEEMVCHCCVSSAGPERTTARITGAHGAATVLKDGFLRASKLRAAPALGAAVAAVRALGRSGGHVGRLPR